MPYLLWTGIVCLHTFHIYYYNWGLDIASAQTTSSDLTHRPFTHGTHMHGIHTVCHTTDHTIDHTIDGYTYCQNQKRCMVRLEEPGYQVGISGEEFSASGGYETIAFRWRSLGYWLVLLWLLWIAICIITSHTVVCWGSKPAAMLTNHSEYIT